MMIKKLAVKNFKSIKDVALDCRRINVFIGEPNVGKSNLLEALGLFSLPYFGDGTAFSRLIRFENFANVFRDADVGSPVSVTAEDERKARHDFSIAMENGHYNGVYKIEPVASEAPVVLRFTANADSITTWSPTTGRYPVRYYRFEPRGVFDKKDGDFLAPFSGANLLFLMQTNPELHALADGLFQSRGFRLVLRPHENKIEVQNAGEGRIVQFPYSSVSDTLKRYIFHLAALRTNRDAVLIFEEPESHAFPFYTKQLAEEMALDARGNQFFVSTHNPYFLLPLVYKAPREELAVFLTSMSGHETRVVRLDDAQMRKLAELDADVFFNFDRFLGSGER
ncbi:MAG: AAA family ATPase [Elusimicrobia bacterium]|nr:AAA family ATPase [Elusimicrobiota bacterium]